MSISLNPLELEFIIFSVMIATSVLSICVLCAVIISLRLNKIEREFKNDHTLCDESLEDEIIFIPRKKGVHNNGK